MACLADIDETLLNLQLWVIDEVCYLRKEFFELLVSLSANIRELVPKHCMPMCGDPFQLPPCNG